MTVAAGPDGKSDGFYIGGDFAVPERLFDLFCGALWEAGTIGIEHSDPDPQGMIHLTAFFPRGTSPGTVLDRVIPWLKAGDNVNISESSWNEVDKVDWSTLWRSSYAPVEIADRLVIIPAWSRRRFPGRTVIRIKPEMAFGTGSHETTFLCLNAVLDTPLAGARVADIGTGSGILAVTAAKLGAAHVDACDVDPEALPNARHNARLNRTADSIDFFHGDIESLPADARYDCIVANIVLEPLLAALPAMAARLTDDGTIHMSGLIEGQAARFMPVAARAGLTITSQEVRNEWILLTLRR